MNLMLDDEKITAKKLVKDIRSRRTAFGKGLNVVKALWWIIIPALLLLVKFEILKFGGLVKFLSIGALASVLDWGIFVDLLPLLRWFPRIALSFDVIGGSVIWVSATAVIMTITVIGAIVMNSRYYVWLKFGDD